MQQRVTFVVLTGVLAATLVHAGLRAQAPASVLAGVYTAEQARRGEVIYAENCASCHGDTLLGSDPNPPLAGKEFQARWKTVGELFDKTASSMPAMSPGSLSGEELAAVIAYTLAVNKYPAGTTELSSELEPLTLIKIEPVR